MENDTTDTGAPDGVATAITTDTAPATGTTTDTASTSTETGPAASVLTDHLEDVTSKSSIDEPLMTILSGYADGPSQSTQMTQQDFREMRAQDFWNEAEMEARTIALNAAIAHNSDTDQVLTAARAFADFLLGTKLEVSGTFEVDITLPDTEAA